MRFRRFLLKTVLNLFPPLLFNRVVLKEIAPDFSTMRVVLRRSLFNMNFHKTIFGGSIFSACDPYFPTMYYHIFANKNRKLIIWLKAAEIRYIKPANSTLNLNFEISQEEIKTVETNLDQFGKTEIWHTIDAINTEGIICAQAKILVYLRDDKMKEKLGF